MFPKSWVQKLLSHHSPSKLSFLYIYKFNHANIIYRFTTITGSTQLDDSSTSESPDLPLWVKLTESKNPGTQYPDDFVLPKSSCFFRNKKSQIQKIENNKPTNDVDSVSKILENRFQSIDEVEKALGNCDFVLSKGLIDQILRRFGNDFVSLLGFFKWARTRMGIKVSDDLYNLMVDNLGKCKKFDNMWELVEEMREIEGCVTILTMTKVMRRLAKARKYEDAIGVFREIDRFGVEKDIRAMNALMDALVKENSAEHAQEVFLEFKDFIKPNASTFNVLIHGWCKNRDLQKAKNVVSEMEKNGFSSDVFSYTCFVEAYCREKDFRRVDLVLKEMEEKGCLPNSVTYTIVMQALGKAKELNKALEVYEKMKLSGCVYDASVYGSLIHILSKSGRLKDARDVFDEMPKRGVYPDVLVYNTMITSVCEHSQEENALKLLSQMETSGHKPDLQTYAPLLKLFCRKQRMKVLSFLLRHMFENGVNPDLATYTLLVRELCNSKKLEQACLYFEEMVMRGLVPMDCTVEMLKKGLEREGLGKAKARVKALDLQAKSRKNNR